MSRKASLREQVRAIADISLRRIREHPFITAALAGRLTKDQVERWIYCAGRESRSFPKILENMIERTTEPVIKSILKKNLDDEYGNGNMEHAHFNHYLHLLDKLAISRDHFFRYGEGPGVKLALSLAYNVSTQNSGALALGYMLVNEGMTPITYGAVQSALTKYYPTLRTKFFELHTVVDERHVAELYEAIDRLDPDALDDLVYGIHVGERGMAVLLDEAYGLFDTNTLVPSVGPDVPGDVSIADAT